MSPLYYLVMAIICGVVFGGSVYSIIRDRRRKARDRDSTLRG